MWTRRRTKLGGEYVGDPDSDWIIMLDGRDEGRINKDHAPYNGASPWKWSAWRLPARNGRVDTLEEAQEAVRQHVLDMIER